MADISPVIGVKAEHEKDAEHKKKKSPNKPSSREICRFFLRHGVSVSLAFGCGFGGFEAVTLTVSGNTVAVSSGPMGK